MAESKDKGFSIVDFTMLCARPKETMELLCSQLGVDFKTSMINGFPKTKNLENWQYNEKVRSLPVNGKPLGNDTNGPNDPWMKNARSAESFHAAKRWKMQSLPAELKKHLNEEFLPIYKKMMQSNHLIAKGNLADYWAYLNPLIVSNLASVPKWTNSIGDKSGFSQIL